MYSYMLYRRFGNFELQNFRVLIFHLKYFCGPEYPRRFFDGNKSVFPSFSDLELHCKNYLVKMTTSEGYCSFRVH